MKKFVAPIFALLLILPATADAATHPPESEYVSCGDAFVRLGDVQGPRLPGQVLYPTCPPVR
jgi:hypothetical protein